MKIDILMDHDAENLIRDAAFREKWRKLYDKCHWGSVFQGEGFVVTWYVTYGSRFTPVIVTGTNSEGELAGLFTLAAAAESGRLVVAGSNLVEYQAWLADPRDGSEFIESALVKLSELFPNRTLTLLFVPPAVPVEWTGPGSRWGSHCHVRTVPRGLMAVGDGSDIEDSLKKKQNRVNRLKRLGNLRFDRLREPEELEAIFDEVDNYEIFRQSAVHNLSRAPQDPLKKSFYISLMRLPRMLHVTALRLDDKLVSAQFHVYNNDQVLLGLIAHSPLYAKHSPGTLHMLMLGVELSKEGIPIFDLTPGGDYKDRYATHNDEVYVITVFFNRIHCLRYKLKRKLADSAKLAIRLFNIAPEQVRDAFHSFADWRQKWSRLKMSALLLELFRKLKENLWCTKELCVYSYDLDRARNSPVNQAMKRDHIPDLLAYQPIEAWQPPVNRFLKRALENLESGNHVYTCVKDGYLVHYGWLIERQGQSPLREVEQALPMPPDSVILTCFFSHPQARGGGLCRSALSQMLHDAGRTSGAKQAYVYVPADNRHLRQAVEEVGFAYSYTLFIRNVLGRITRWSNDSKAATHPAD